jgi:hypothetical protein
MNNFWKIVIGAVAAATASYMVSSGIKNSRLKKTQARDRGGAAIENDVPAPTPKLEILDKRPGHKACSGCGEKVAEYDFFCPACGSPMDQVAAAGSGMENRA